MTREEREVAYKIARERIFGNASDKLAESGPGLLLPTLLLRHVLIDGKITTRQMEFLVPVLCQPKINPISEREGKQASSVEMTRRASIRVHSTSNTSLPNPRWSGRLTSSPRLCSIMAKRLGHINIRSLSLTNPHHKHILPWYQTMGTRSTATCQL